MSSVCSRSCTGRGAGRGAGSRPSGSRTCGRRTSPRVRDHYPDYSRRFPTRGTGARYYGGARFDALREPDEEWAAFGAYRFVLPRFELHAGDAETTLVCNLVLPRDAQKRP